MLFFFRGFNPAQIKIHLKDGYNSWFVLFYMTGMKVLRYYDMYYKS